MLTIMVRASVASMFTQTRTKENKEQKGNTDRAAAVLLAGSCFASSTEKKRLPTAQDTHGFEHDPTIKALQHGTKEMKGTGSRGGRRGEDFVRPDDVKFGPTVSAAGRRQTVTRPPPSRKEAKTTIFTWAE